MALDEGSVKSLRQAEANVRSKKGCGCALCVVLLLLFILLGAGIYTGYTSVSAKEAARKELTNRGIAETQYRDALIKAAQTGQTEQAELLIRAGADINATDIHGRTSLRTAAYYGNREIVQLLIQAGAEINRKNAYGLTPLDYARDSEIRQLLIEAGGVSGK